MNKNQKKLRVLQKKNQRIIASLNKKPKPLFFWRGYILDWVIDIAIAGIIVYIITTFAFQNMFVVGNSMTPTLKHGETVLINKMTYHMKKPSRNDLISFKHVDPSENEINIVKRIIGVPGDKIEVINDRMYINNELVEYFVEEYNKQPMPIAGNMEYPIVVPAGAYFVLGDNKNNSMDSRYQEIGMIPEKEIEGKLCVRIWPLWKIKLL